MRVHDVMRQQAKSFRKQSFAIGNSPDISKAFMLMAENYEQYADYIEQVEDENQTLRSEINRLAMEPLTAMNGSIVDA